MSAPVLEHGGCGKSIAGLGDLYERYEGRPVMLKLVQASIVLGFLAWNIAEQWTPNPMVPGIIGAGVAYLVTLMWMKIEDWRSALRRRELRRISAAIAACASVRTDEHPRYDALRLDAGRVQPGQLRRLGNPVRGRE